MDFASFGIASVACITVICYLAATAVKQTPLANKWLPSICGTLGGVLGVLADKDYKDMLSDLAPCFAKIYTVTPNCPRALSAEELQKEARFHTDAEAADSVADAIRKAVDYADENNLAGVVVCGSLYLAAEARPLLLKEAEK